MIVVDTSVWIGHFRHDATSAVQRLRMIDDANDILVGDVVLLECLQSARNQAHAAQIETALRSFETAPMIDTRLAIQGARNHRTLRSLGITPRKTVDVIIATLTLAHGFVLLHQDRDFDPWAQHLGLRFL